MKQGLLKTARVILFLSLGFLLLWLSFRGINLKDLANTLLKADYYWLFASIAISVIAFFLRSRRWILLIEPLGQKPSLSHTYHSVVTGYLANIIFPRLGEVTRCAALGRKENMPFEKLVGTVIIERTIDLFSLLFLLCIALLAGSSHTGNFVSDNIVSNMNRKLSAVFGSSLIVYLTVIGIAILAVYLFFKLRKKLIVKPLFRKIYSFIDGIFDGLKSIGKLKRKWEFLILTFLMWVCYLLMAFFPLNCLASTSEVGIRGALFILVMGSLGMAVPVQSGIGAYHWVVSRGLLFVYDIPLEEGLAYATLSHESQLVMIAVLGLFSLFMLFGRKSGRIFTSPTKATP